MFEVITESDFRRRIKNPEAGYLFFGDEDYLKHNAVTVARESIIPDAFAVQFDYIALDRSGFSPSALAGALSAPAMFGGRRLVVASVSFDDLRAAEVSELLEVLAGVPDNDNAVLILNTPAGGFDAGYPRRPSAVLKKISEFIVPVRFDRITPARLASWAARHYTSNGVTAGDDICAATVDYCGTDMFRLASEIDKVSYFVLASGRNAVTADDLRRAACAAEEFDTFALANAMTAGQYARALDVLAVMKAQKTEPAFIMSELIRVICDMTAVAVCMHDGMSQNEISEATGIKPYPLGRCINALRGMNEPRRVLKRAVAACVEADAGIKGYTQDYIPIEKLICSL